MHDLAYIKKRNKDAMDRSDVASAKATERMRTLVSWLASGKPLPPWAKKELCAHVPVTQRGNSG